MRPPLRPHTDLEALFRARYAALVERLRVRTGDRELARDAVAQAFLRLLERGGRLRDPRSAERWLWVVACREASRMRCRAGPLPPGAELPAPEDGPAAVERRLDLFADLARLRRAWARLSPAQRHVLLLRYGRRWPREQIAAAMGVGGEPVKKRLQRALACLRRLMGPDPAPAPGSVPASREGRSSYVDPRPCRRRDD